MLTRRRSVVVICIAIAVCVALVPVLDVSALALLTPVWSMFAVVLLGTIALVEVAGRPQALALLSLRGSRAPPR